MWNSTTGKQNHGISGGYSHSVTGWRRPGLPDIRFGQLMVNLLRDYETEHGQDFFFLEENEMIEVIDEYCERFMGRKKE